MSMKSPSRGQAFRCPFPDCDNADVSAEPTCIQVPGLKLCECVICGRISSRCIFDDCSGLNRAFSRFCAHCGRSLWDSDSPVQIDDFWRSAVQPANLVQRAAVTGGDEAAAVRGRNANAAVVATLDSRLFPPRKELLSWAIVDGILLLHQGGGGIAAIYAYVNRNQVELNTDESGQTDAGASDEEQWERLSTAKPPFWSAPERTALPVPDRWRTKSLPHLNPEFGRPYAPVVTGDHRFALFSAPYGAAVLPLSDLPGWSAQLTAGLIPLLRLGNQPQPQWTLAAPPVPIEHHRSDGTLESAIGLLLSRRPEGQTATMAPIQYFWQVVDLNPGMNEKDPLSANLLESLHSKPLPLEGSICQVFHMGGRGTSSETGLLFATPRGMWIARVAYDDRHSPLVVSPVQTENEAFVLEGIRLNTEVESRNRFRWDRLLVSPSYEALDESQLITWYANHRESGECAYNVLSFPWPTAGQKTVLASAISVSNRPVAPVGIGRNSGIRDAFFLTADRGELFSHQIGEQPKFEHRAFATNMDELIGLTLCDPLVIAVRKTRAERPDAPAADIISVRSLRNPEHPAVNFGPFRLESDPIYWMGGVYFCERLQDRLTVRRIDLRGAFKPTTPTPTTRGTL